MPLERLRGRCSCCFGFQGGSVREDEFELDRGTLLAEAVTAHTVVEPVDPVGHDSTSLGLGLEVVLAQALEFKRRKERFTGRVVQRRPDSAHGLGDPEAFAHFGEVPGAVFRTAVAVKDYP